MLLREFGSLSYSISYTTREPRPGEEDGVHYHFIDRSSFVRMIAGGEFIEHAIVHDNYYGTAKKGIEVQLETGDVLLDIDPQGAMQLREVMDGVFVFILPPSFEELRRRLEGRQDTSSQLDLRLKNARDELAYLPRYDYAIVNDDLDNAYKELSSIYIAGRCSTMLIEWPLKLM